MYVLTLNNGAAIKFYLKSCAEIFQQCYGGKLVFVERFPGDTVETYWAFKTLFMGVYKLLR